MADMILSRIS